MKNINKSHPEDNTQYNHENTSHASEHTIRCCICCTCGKRYKTPNTLKFHMKTKHNVEDENEFKPTHEDPSQDSDDEYHHINSSPWSQIMIRRGVILDIQEDLL